MGEREHKNIKAGFQKKRDTMKPLPQWYEVTEWERQIVKEQEREREGPRASER